jgi:hypothetical protein
MDPQHGLQHQDNVFDSLDADILATKQFLQAE